MSGAPPGNLPYGWTEDTDGDIVFYKSNWRNPRPTPHFAVLCSTVYGKSFRGGNGEALGLRSTTRQPEIIRPGNWYYYNNFTAESTEEKPPLFAKQSSGKQLKYLVAAVKLQNFVRQRSRRKRVRVKRAKKNCRTCWISPSMGK